VRGGLLSRSSSFKFFFQSQVSVKCWADGTDWQRKSWAIDSWELVLTSVVQFRSGRDMILDFRDCFRFRDDQSNWIYLQAICNGGIPDIVHYLMFSGIFPPVDMSDICGKPNCD
jgi:hypothetical protein